MPEDAIGGIPEGLQELLADTSLKLEQVYIMAIERNNHVYIFRMRLYSRRRLIMFNSNKILIIVGMHRSGTTLTARSLQDCGLYIGEQLLKSKYDHANPGGLHYEDLDFLRVHKSILTSSRLDSDGFITDEKIILLPAHVQSAVQILAARSHLMQWGWKEPRTCLFLDFWLEQLPSAKLLIVYRHYEQVADSLLRRKLDHEKLLRRMFYRLRFRPVHQFAKHYIKVWSRYNRDILATAQQRPDAVLVLRTRDIVDHSAAIVAYLNQVWDFALKPVDTSTIFEQKRLQKEASYVDMHDARLSNAVAEAQSIYEELEQWRTQSIAQLAQLSLPKKI